MAATICWAGRARIASCALMKKSSAPSEATRTFSEGPGNDVIDVGQYRSAGGDLVRCGSGFDRVLAEKTDVVAPDCEKVVVFMGGTHSDFVHFFNRFYRRVVPTDFYKALPACHCRIFGCPCTPPADIGQLPKK